MASQSMQTPSASSHPEPAPHRDLWPGIAGVVAGVLLIAGHILWLRTPDTTGPGAIRNVVTFYAKDSNQALAETSALMLLAAGLLFMFFLVALSRLAGNRSHLVLVGGTVFTVLLMVSAIAGNMFAITASTSDVFRVGPQTAHIAILLLDLAYAAAIASMAGAAVLLFAVWRAARESRAVPMWLAWFGFVVAVLSLGAMFSAWATPVLLGVWVVAAGVVLILNARVAQRDEGQEPAVATGTP
ncbi:hypothetical protein AB0P36_05700 [Streptomyces flavidovirens]|uniref:hypothetical protein n=1 Tax=Streptomyces flavidovirens TaxID=67298 RepID=UPI00342B8E70